MEDIDFKHPRGLDKQLMLSLGSCEWIKTHHNIFIMGPTGIGKSYLACAIAQKACREG
jgi:DNA replication protein DnaC